MHIANVGKEDARNWKLCQTIHIPIVAKVGQFVKVNSRIAKEWNILIKEYLGLLEHPPGHLTLVAFQMTSSTDFF